MAYEIDDNVVITGDPETPATILEINGISAQSNPLQTWRNNAGDKLAQISSDGRLEVGDVYNETETPNSLVEAHRIDDPLTPSSKPKRGFHSLGQIASTSTSALNTVVSWIVQELELIGTTGINALHRALRVKLTNQVTGTMNNADLRAGDFEIINEGGGSGVGNSVTKMTGIQVAVTNNSGAHLSEAVGIRVAITNAGTLGKAYALYTDNGTLHFGEDLELKVFSTTPPTNPPTDFIKAYIKLDADIPKLYAKNSTGIETPLGGSENAQSSATKLYLHQNYFK